MLYLLSIMTIGVTIVVITEMHEVHVYPDVRSLVFGAAELILESAHTALTERGRFSLGLSGGSTPADIYATLALDERFQLDWSQVHLFWGDERCVPPDDLQSNYHMVHEKLLQHVPIPPDNIYRMKGEIDPAQAAAEYEHQLRMFFGKDITPRFDLILLGMGEDGHTASLFPNTDAIFEQERWVVAHYIEKLDTWRITLTPVVINAAYRVAFIVAGEKKADKLKQILQGKYQPSSLPSQIIQPAIGQLLWLVDEAAASKLE